MVRRRKPLNKPLTHSSCERVCNERRSRNVPDCRWGARRVQSAVIRVAGLLHLVVCVSVSVYRSHLELVAASSPFLLVTRASARKHLSLVRTPRMSCFINCMVLKLVVYLRNLFRPNYIRPTPRHNYFQHSSATLHAHVVSVFFNYRVLC